MQSPKPAAKAERAFSVSERFAELARATRLRNMTLQDVIRNEFGISRSHARLLLLNQRRPSPEVAERIARFVGVDVATFWGVATFNSRPKSSTRRSSK